MPQTVPQKHIRRCVIFHSTAPSLAKAQLWLPKPQFPLTDIKTAERLGLLVLPFLCAALKADASTCFSLFAYPGRFPGGLSTLEQVAEFMGDNKSCEL